jgi:hypothetical protein
MLITSFFYSHLTAQYQTINPRVKHKSNIRVTSWTLGEQKGKLYNTYDTAISIMSMSNYKKYHTLQMKESDIDILIAESDLMYIPVGQINYVYIRKNRSIWMGALIGAAVGITLGVLIGQKEGDDPPATFPAPFSFSANEKSIMYGFGLSIPCALIGTYVGATIELKIPINRSQQEYSKRRSKFDKYKYAGNE